MISPDDSVNKLTSLRPGTSGGIFAMRKDWFEQLGLFDEGMREWGGACSIET